MPERRIPQIISFLKGAFYFANLQVISQLRTSKIPRYQVKICISLFYVFCLDTLNTSQFEETHRSIFQQIENTSIVFLRRI